MNEIRIIISPDQQTVEVVYAYEDGTLVTVETIQHENICYAVVLATDFIKEMNREHCVTCYKNEREWENTIGMCDTCWTAELRRQRGE